jgi:hypothetical protein
VRKAIKRASLALGLGALIACSAAAGAAQAATIYACVKPKSGATRIVTAKAKCRRGEKKLSWNTTGPRGPAGANGANGAGGASGAEGKAGANGAATVYSTSQSQTEPLSLPSGTTLVLSKVLPPGSYAVTAKTTITASETKKATVEMFCELADQPAGGSESRLIDLTGWEAPLGENGPTDFSAEAPLTLAGTITSSVTSTLAMGCANNSGQSMKSALAQMLAISVAAVR